MAIGHFNGSILHAHPKREVTNEDLAEAIRYLAAGMRDVAEALKQ